MRTRSYAHTFIRSYAYTLIHSYAHTFIRSYAHTFIRSYAHTLIRSHAHTFIHTRTRTRTHAHAHTHTHTRAQLSHPRHNHTTPLRLFVILKVALQIWGRKFNKKTKKSSIYSLSLLIFIHKTLVVENHPTTREIRDLLWPMSIPTGNTVYFYMSSSLIYIPKIHRRSFRYSSDDGIVESNSMFVILWNLSIISHWIFPQCFLAHLSTTCSG